KYKKNYFIIDVLASAPDRVLDFCIAKSAENSLTCKNSSTTTVEDFTYFWHKLPGNFKQTGFSSMAVNSNVFPGLNTLGVSFLEQILSNRGKIYSGFVDTNNKVFCQSVKERSWCSPRGLLHFQMNVGDGPVTILGSFDTGLMRIPNAVFGSDIKEELLEKAFGLSSKELSKLMKRFSSI
ncbi:hypothetical protein PHAVU_007G021400, partial [Phaseolus vulgaris]